MKQINFKLFHDETVRDLYEALIGSDRDRYFVLRDCLIMIHGYDTFRDIQCEAFNLVFKDESKAAQ